MPSGTFVGNSANIKAWAWMLVQKSSKAVGGLLSWPLTPLDTMPSLYFRHFRDCFQAWTRCCITICRLSRLLDQSHSARVTHACASGIAVGPIPKGPSAFRRLGNFEVPMAVSSMRLEERERSL
jgi:hypothetical protein